MELQLFDEAKFNQAVKLSSTLAKSTVVPMHFRNKPEEVFAALVMGAELGFQPMQALNSIVFINGQATTKTAAMLAQARAKVKDLSVKIVESPNEVRTTMTRGDDSYTAIWNDEKAGAMGLLGKDNYKKQKMTMYRWRSISEGLKIICPDILMGLNTAEEMDDLPPLRNDPLIDIQQAAREDAERMQDEAIPPEEKTVGPLYRVQNAKYRGKQLYQIPLGELVNYGQTLRMRTTPKKAWEVELISVIDSYAANVDLYREQILELMSEEE